MKLKYLHHYYYIGYLTGVTQSVWDLYASVQNSMNLEIDCLQLNVSKSSNTSFDALASAFLMHNGSTIGVNATAATEFLLQDPDSNTNTSDSEYLWNAYASQIFVNGASWSNFTSNGTSTDNATTSGSEPVPGTKPFASVVYSKLIDSNAQPGSNSSTKYDTVFLWTSMIQTFDPSQLNKRVSEVYGVVLSKTSSIGQDTFNKTLALLPLTVAQNNISVVMLNDTCHNTNGNSH
jgi:hypothetical protein